MKKLLVLVVCGILLPILSSLPPQVSSQSQPDGDYVPDRIIVKFRAGWAPGTVEFQRPGVITDDLQLPVRASSAELFGTEIEDRHVLMHLDATISVPEAIALVQSDPRVEYAEPDYYIRPSQTVPNDEFFGLLWGLANDGLNGFGKAGADIGATRAWDMTTGSDTLVVAVVDTGLDITHPDLAANVWINPGEIPDNGFDDDGNGFVDDVHGWNFFSNSNQVFDDLTGDFHGTHVAGTIGAVGNNGLGVTGVAWNVRLMSLKFLGRNPAGQIRGTTSDAVKSIDYVKAHRKRGINVRVINASWGSGSTSEALKSSIKSAGKQGILFVAAAGNGGGDGIGNNIDEVPDYPAAYGRNLNTVVSVAALDWSDNLAVFSNFGVKSVNVGAPGMDIRSTSPGGLYRSASGTSMAAPHVSGIAALIWSMEPDLRPKDVKARIIATAEPIVSLAARTVSAGRANAHNALLNRIPPVDDIAIGRLEADKKWLTIDGLGLIKDDSIVEVNGTPIIRKTKFQSVHRIANGTFTQMRVKFGKNRMDTFVPVGIPVNITVFNPSTGMRSEPMPFVRN